MFAWATFVSVVITQINELPLSSLPRHFSSVLIVAPLCTLFAALSAYIVNDLSDLGVDKINEPNRPMVTGISANSDALTLMLLLDTGALIMSSTFGFFAFLMIFLETIGSIAYSLRPFEIKNRFLSKTVSIGIGGIFSSIFGAVALGQELSSTVLYAACMFFVYLFATSPLKDLADMVGDVDKGRRTIPIAIGQGNTVVLSIVASTIPFATSLVFARALNVTFVMPIVMALVMLRSAQLLVPLLEERRRSEVNRIHRQMILHHFLLQTAIMIGTIPI